MRELNFRAAVAGGFVALVVSYVLCILGDVLFGWTMYQAWMPLLPGFAWPLSAGGFFIGLVWLILYSFYLPIVFVLPYNYFIRKAESRSDAG